MKRMLSRTIGLVALLVLTVSAAGVNQAYEVPIINKYGQTGLWNTQSARTLGMGRMVFNLYGNYSGHKDFINEVTTAYEADGTPSDSLDAIPEFTMTTLNVALGYGFTRFLDLSVMLPIYIDWIGTTTFYNSGTAYDYYPASGNNDPIGGAGDLTVAMTFQYPPYPHRRFFEMAYYGALTLPTGNPGYGRFPRHMYYHNKDNYADAETEQYFTAGKGKVEIDMKMLWTMDFRELAEAFPVLFHMNYGLRWNTNYYNEHVFLFNAGLEVRPTNFLALFLDFSAEPRFGSIQLERTPTPKSVASGALAPKRNMASDPLRLSPGIAFLVPGGFNMTFGTDISLASDTGNYTRSALKSQLGDTVYLNTAVEPKVSLAASIGWAGFVLPQDQDNDGIKDNNDNCPKEAEDYDGYNDGDGCPEYDNDNDGIPDTLDKCVNDAEDKDGFEDEDGCPDVDNDKDGVLDAADKCPLVAEDIDNFEDEDGCPELDNDKDGVADSVDACINKPEDMDGFKDEDGCPEPDNDLDGIPDSLDKCPSKPETFNTFEDEDGCPDEKPIVKVAPKAKEISRSAMVLNGVNFMSGKAVLTSDSYTMLNEVVRSLQEWPETKIEVQGHTDSVGSESSNKRLSYKRARTVMDYFSAQGIDPSRLRAVGMGESRPVADNATAEGRSMNRRVELHRID